MLADFLDEFDMYANFKQLIWGQKKDVLPFILETVVAYLQLTDCVLYKKWCSLFENDLFYYMYFDGS